MFIMYGPVSELMVSLRKLLQRLSEEGEIEVIYRIIQKFNFEQIIFNSMFGVAYDKKTKTEHEGYIRNKDHDVELLAPLPFYGKRMHPCNLAESWKIVTILLTLNNMYLEMPENELKEERTFYLSNIYYLKRALCDPNIETKIMSLIIESSSSRGIYYMYLTMKELNFHTKVFASAERALKDYESIKFRPFFLYFEHAINDKDLPASDKEKIMDIIERSYKQNDKYFLETDSIHQWVLRVEVILCSWSQ